MTARDIFTHVLLLPLLLPLLPATRAQPVPWNHPDGTTHWYQAFALPSGSDWERAQESAVRLGAHLATITSQAENDLVFQLVDDPSFWVQRPQGTLAGPWIGGVQPAGSAEPGGGWVWVSGEPLGYANWSAGQPDDQNGTEDRIHFGEVAGMRTPTWNDADGTGDVGGYVVEWSGFPPDQTTGLFRRRGASWDGYTLLAPLRADGTVHLIDPDGRSVHTWHSTHPNGYSAYLLDDGSLLRSVALSTIPVWNGIFTGGMAGGVERHLWNGNLVWQFQYDTPQHVSHHDVELLPNGNVLMIAWERKTAAEAMAAGRHPALLVENELWPDSVIEVAPNGQSGGTIVWEWHLWDHLVQDWDPSAANFGVVAAHPELVDVNYTQHGRADWTHVNSIDYNPALDQIMLSVHGLGEIWVIDHSTTTAQAAGHSGGNSGRGGDILYRWGNPEVYRAGTAADRKLYGQHDAQWIEPGLPGEGNVLIYNNGRGRPEGAWSSIEEIVPPVDPSGSYSLPPAGPYGPAAPVWSYAAVHPTDFYSGIISGTQRLPNGNTLICSGVTGTLFEVTPAGECVWHYKSPVTSAGPITQGTEPPDCGALTQCNSVFKVRRYAATHPGLAGRDLSPGDPVEAYPPEIAARFGSVNMGSQSRADVLLVNGARGDVWREAYAAAGAPVTVSLQAPPAGPAAAPYALYLLLGEPGPADIEVQPGGLGTACMPFPLLGGPLVPPQYVLANTTGVPLLGAPVLPGLAPAPATVFTSPLPPGTYTVQGIVLDNGGAGPPASVTNAVVLHVR